MLDADDRPNRMQEVDMCKDLVNFLVSSRGGFSFLHERFSRRRWKRIRRNAGLLVRMIRRRRSVPGCGFEFRDGGRGDRLVSGLSTPSDTQSEEPLHDRRLEDTAAG